MGVLMWYRCTLQSYFEYVDVPSDVQVPQQDQNEY